MKDKILFFTDLWFINFGMAKSLQDKYDAELYAIIDVDEKARTFFEKQKLVKYEKVWYYTDCLSGTTQKPDLNYLSSLEKKYGINLWSIAYVDRDFYLYNSYHKFKEDEILLIIEREARFFEEILDNAKPNFLVLFVTASHYQQLLYELCRSRGIKILMLGTVKFANRAIISENDTRIDYVDYLEKNIAVKNRTIEELQNYMKNLDSFRQQVDFIKTAFESNKWKRYWPILKFFLSFRNDTYKKRYTNYGRTRLKVLTVKISNFFKKKYRKYFINKNFIRELPENKNFIYYPLHFEPERVILIEASFYANQISIITNIAKSLPIGYNLYVKEHPTMKIMGWRSISFYKQIMDLPNVKLIHPSVTPDEIIKKCSLVITIAGTASQEAAFYQKPSIVFVNQFYSSLSSVHKLQKIEELPQLIRNSLQTKVSVTNLNEYVELINNNTFELDIVKLSTDFSYRFGLKGPIMDTILPESEIESFLKKYNSVFDLLAEEHIKKIKQHKKYEATKS